MREGVRRTRRGGHIPAALIVDRPIDPGGVHRSRHDARVAHRDGRTLQRESSEDGVRSGRCLRGPVLRPDAGEYRVRRALRRCRQVLVRTDDRTLVGDAEVQLRRVARGRRRREHGRDEGSQHEGEHGRHRPRASRRQQPPSRSPVLLLFALGIRVQRELHEHSPVPCPVHPPLRTGIRLRVGRRLTELQATFRR